MYLLTYLFFHIFSNYLSLTLKVYMGGYQTIHADDPDKYIWETPNSDKEA